MIAAQTADDNRGRDIVILDLRDMTTFFDYFVVVSGTSRRQLHAISEEIDHALEEGLGDRRLGIEGYSDSRWILLDYGDVVIHIFEPRDPPVLRSRKPLGTRQEGSLRTRKAARPPRPCRSWNL